MRVFTPDETSKPGSKYLGLLVAARYARELNALPRDTMPATRRRSSPRDRWKRWSTTSFEFNLVKRRRKGTV